MRPDQLSRSISGDRAFSSIEIARIADELGQDVHWLITGRPDPMRRRLVARHQFDSETSKYSTPHWNRDQDILANIELAYRQAYSDDEISRTRPSYPSAPSDFRSALGDGFVRYFIDRVEWNLSIDVVRLQEISHSYTMQLGHHMVIVVSASGSWFYENYSIAHELGHIAANHLDAPESESHERAANNFAAQLLLPTADVKAQDWQNMNHQNFATYLWHRGVSTHALRLRLGALRQRVSPAVSQWLRTSTFDVLNQCDVDLDEQAAVHAVAARQVAAAQRRFPTSLIEAHLNRVVAGSLSQDTLAWMLGVERVLVDDETASDFMTDDAPTFSDFSTVGSDRLANLLGN